MRNGVAYYSLLTNSSFNKNPNLTFSSFPSICSGFIYTPDFVTFFKKEKY